MSPVTATLAACLALTATRLVFRLSQLAVVEYPRTTTWTREQDATAVVVQVLALLWLAYVLWSLP